tara:strand:- start:1199 stop:1417 length:219 start_codon:yes stop_codon:yes gene_type:complete
MSGVNRYLEEYEKYKHIQLETDIVYNKKSRTSERMVILEINNDEDKAQVKNLRTENIQYKTLHWCRKNLIKE